MRLLLYIWSERRRLVRFVAVGLTCMAIHFGIFMWLHEEGYAHYQTANIVGFLVALVINFTLNKLLTFNKTTTEGMGKESLKFLGKKALFYVLGAALLHILVEWLHMKPWHAQLVLIPTLGLLGFVYLQKFVFNR